jgi:predicted  nucleic acid-binding Zn-ribbon protein
MNDHPVDEPCADVSSSPLSPCRNDKPVRSGPSASTAKGSNAEIPQLSEGKPGMDKAPSKGETSSSRGLILDAMRLLGQGAGLTQLISAKTADSVVSAGRRTGTFLTAPLKRHAPPIRRARKKRTARPDAENKPRPADREVLCSKLGERICCLTQLDPSSLLTGLQRDASATAARDEADGITALTLRLSGDAGKAPDRKESPEKPAASEQEGEASAAEDRNDGLARELAEVRGKLEQAEQLIARIHTNEIETREKLHEKEEALSAATRDLEEAQHRADDERSRHAAELDSLRSEFESVQTELTETKAAADEARAETHTLASDLASARNELDEARKQAQTEQSRLSSQLDAIQAENEALQAELTDIQAEAQDATSRAERLEAELSEPRASSASEGEEDEDLPHPEPQLGDSLHSTVAETTDPPSDEYPNFPDEPADPPISELEVQTDVKEPATRVTEEDAPVFARVTAEDVQAADFRGVSEKVMLTRTLSDMDMNRPDSIRARAARSMGNIRHALSAQALIAQLRDETSANARKECILALTALDAKQGLPVIRWALKDEAAAVRLAAVRAIYRLAGSEGAGVLAQMLHDVDEDVKRRAATCLGWLGHKSMASELIPLLRDESASVRLAGLEALGNLKSSAVVDKIIERLDDPEESVQRRAFHVLETITGKRM